MYVYIYILYYIIPVIHFSVNLQTLQIFKFFRFGANDFEKFLKSAQNGKNGMTTFWQMTFANDFRKTQDMENIKMDDRN